MTCTKDGCTSKVAGRGYVVCVRHLLEELSRYKNGQTV